MPLTRRALLVLVAAVVPAGCAIGPQMLQQERLRYNEVVKTGTEEQLLLNIVRLRYTDSPSSVAVTTVADQFELTQNLGLTPFFQASAAGQAFGGYRGAILPQAGVGAAARPTLTYTPQDDQDFTRRLFTPLSIDAVAGISKTTWPISTVFRLWLENLNWVSNAETVSGPTPRIPPQYENFLAGVLALQPLTDRKLATVVVEEVDDPVGDEFPAVTVPAGALGPAAKEGFEFRRGKKPFTWQMVRKKQEGSLRFAEAAKADPDFQLFCRVFKLDPTRTTFPFTGGKVDPYLKGAPLAGLDKLELETRSLLQVLFYLAHGIDVPAEHLQSGIAPSAVYPDGRVFDWRPMFGGLFLVHSAAGKEPPPGAHVAVSYKGYWFYIDEADRDTKATFALLMALSRLQLSTDKAGPGPLLTLPIGGGR